MLLVRLFFCLLFQFFYIELAVDLRRNVKDAFVQYRMICQQAQSGSMEKVMKHYQKLAEAKAAEAQQKAADAAAAMEAGKPQGEQAADTVATVEDLEEESPESIMLAAMSGEVRALAHAHAPSLRLFHFFFRSIGSSPSIVFAPCFSLFSRAPRSVWTVRF